MQEPTTTKPRAALYCRVSTPAQIRKGDPWASLPRQEETLRQEAARRGFEVGPVVLEQRSGVKGHREGWESVLTAATDGEVQVVMAVANDRLSRAGVGAAEALRKQAREAGFRIITLKQGEMDLSGSASANLRNNLESSVSAYEADLIRERTVDGRTAKGQAGGYTGHVIPYGYEATYDRTGAKVFEVMPERAAVVREVFERYAAGESVVSLCCSLTTSGVPAPGMYGKGGAHWHDGTVAAMLGSPLYAGLSLWGREKGLPPVPSTAFAPIVERELWDTVQARRAVGKLRRTREGPTWPLSGILRCSACGHGVIHNQATPHFAYYACGNSARHRKSRCPGPFAKFSARTADEAVLTYLREHLEPYLKRQLDPAALEAYQAGKKAAPRRDDTAALEKRRAALEGQRAKAGARMALEDDEAVLAGLRDALRSIASELATAEAQIASVKQQAIKAASVKAITRAMSALLGALYAVRLDDRDNLRRVFDALLVRVTLEKTSEPRARQVLRVATCELRDGGSV